MITKNLYLMLRTVLIGQLVN